MLNLGGERVPPIKGSGYRIVFFAHLLILLEDL